MTGRDELPPEKLARQVGPTPSLRSVSSKALESARSRMVGTFQILRLNYLATAHQSDRVRLLNNTHS